MRKPASLVVLVLMLLTVAVAKDKKEYMSGRLVDLRTQNLQGADLPKAKGESLSTVRLGGTPTIQVTRYSVILTTDTELLYLSCDRDTSSLQPVLKMDEYLKFRSTGPDNIELVDMKGKKFDFEVLRRVTRDAPTLKGPSHAPAAQPVTK